MASSDELKQEIASFLEGYSIEATPHDADKLSAFTDVLPAGTAVYMAHPPGSPLTDIVELSGRLQALGFKAVPHIIARKLESREQLERALADLQQAGVDQALVIAGDQGVAQPPFDSSLDVLQTGLFSRYGFREVGVAGHPEGSKAIGEARVEQALRDKTAFAKDADFNVRIVTQFGFDPEALTNWERRTSEAGIDLPVHVGLAGPASLRQLVRFAMLCGIGSSARMMMTRTGATANLLRTQAPDELVTHIARHRATDPSTRLRKAHFFAFGGVLKTAKWANAVVQGQFELNSRGAGFEVG